MTQILKSLDEITTEYTVFEKDQVLTASHLNSVANYFEDQTRLTRTQLLGVGIICGLNVTLTGSQITVSKGMGTTTDGDLLFYGSDITFDNFKSYDDKNPRYEPFFRDEVMMPVYELVPTVQDVADSRAFPLEQFTDKTDQKLEQMVALLFMESYIFDPDQCTAVDCNNAGQMMTNNLKVLLVDRAYIGWINSMIQTPHQAYDQLDEVAADRPVINSAVKAHAQLVTIYRGVCNAIQTKLATQLPKIYPACSSFLAPVFSADPSASWLTVLKNWNDYYTNNEIGIQYYYDFLRDLTETYNEFKDLLFDDNTWCSPDKDAFPKHLILGALNGDSGTDAERTGFYPSQLTSHTLEKKLHAEFLASKLDAQLMTFEVPSLTRRIGLNVSLNLLENIKPAEMIIPSNLWRITRNTDIRITPGRSEEYCLEERAIPYYYKIDASHPIYEYWNYNLHKKKKSTNNYYYNARNFGAQGASAAPFSSQIGKFDFFRIEGFIGQNIVDVHKFLENEISTNNLPIHLRSVMLGEDRTKIVIKPPFYFGHLHQLHNMMRQDIVNQLDEAKQFSAGLKTRVLDNIELLDPIDKGTYTKVAETRNNDLTAAAERATSKLKISYQDYTTQNTATDSWQTHLGEAMKQSGGFKNDITLAAKTEFNTPFDSLVTNRHVNMLDHLDILINRDVELKETRLLFNNYIARHPGLEHCGGVMRGGTFVLAYDENSTIVADFMLPYQEIDAEKNDQLEPDIAIKPVRPNFVINSGLNILEPLDIRIKGKLDNFRVNDLDGILNAKTEGIRSQLDNAWNSKFSDQQKDYFSTIKESFGTMSSALIKRIATNPATEVTGANFQDANLERAVKDVTSQRDVLAGYKTKAETTTDPAEKQRYIDLAGSIENDLSTSISAVSQYVANTNMDVAMGTDGFRAMMEINNSMSSISNAAILTKTTESLNKLADTAQNASFNLVVKNIIRR